MSEQPRQGRRLLVVDDEPMILSALHEYLTGRGFAVDCASEREEALALVAHVRYAAVIADLQLSGGHDAGGLEVVAAVRERAPATRVVLCSSLASLELVRGARAQGIDAVLNKPTPLADVAVCLENLLAGAAA
jgi:CheY-like chemotaxis protein